MLLGPATYVQLVTNKHETKLATIAIWHGGLQGRHSAGLNACSHNLTLCIACSGMLQTQNREPAEDLFSVESLAK